MIIGENVVLEDIAHENIGWIRQRRNNAYLRQFFREWKDISSIKQEEWYRLRGANTDPNHIFFQIMALPNADNIFLNKKDFENLKRDIPDFIEVETRERVENRFIVGYCCLSYIDWRLGAGEFGIFVDTSVRGCGLGKEALTLMLDYGFKEANLHKVWGEVWDNNKAINVFREIGFKDDGLLRDAYFHNGKYGNSYVVSILEDEWREKYGDGLLWKIDRGIY
jgi:RimJ/RimL family protein N-acetyltransferase